MPSMKIGYARVSTEDQILALQFDALRAAECESVHRDELSGAAVQRPGLMAALAACHARGRAGSLEAGPSRPVHGRATPHRGRS